MGTKTCKYCKSQIPKAAKVCPHCARKQGGILKWIILGFIVICIIGAAAGGGSEKDSDSNSETAKTENDTSAEKAENTESAEVAEQQEIVYTDIDTGTLMSDLEANAMSASDTYKGNYYAITGKLSNIDAQGGYITIVDQNDEWAIIGVTCYIKNDETREKVKTLSTDSVITVRGKITDVGEVFGYYLNIDSID